jgi:hypothetical protein
VQIKKNQEDAVCAGYYLFNKQVTTFGLLSVERIHRQSD